MGAGGVTRLMGKLLGMTGLLTVPAVDTAAAQRASQALRQPSRQPTSRVRQLPRLLRIPATDLVDALRMFSRQTGLSVGFAPALVRRRIATAVDGRFDPDLGLARLLTGTGLTFRTIDGGYVLAAAPVDRPRPVAPRPPLTHEDGVDIVVIGTRLGGGDPTDVKRRSLQSVSALSAEDIRKVADTSLADIVRRIPGVQLSVRAAGALITVRGLSQTEYRLNGRNLTSTLARGFDIAALPSDIVAGIDVYKTPSASQIEGGIGGVIDFHTRRPFDAADAEATATVKGVYGDLDGRVRPYVSGHAGRRWTTDAGEIGLLIGASHQAQDVAGDIFRTNTNASRITASGQNLDAPVDAIKRYLRGTKVLDAGYASAQWRPDPTFEIIGDLLYNRSTLDFTTTSLTASLADGVASGPFDLHAGTIAVRSGRWTQVPLASSTTYGQGFFETRQYGLSGRYEQGPLSLLVNVAQTGTRFRYRAPTATLRAAAPQLDYDVDGDLPGFTISGIDQTRAESWRFATFSDVGVRDDNRETNIRFDGVRAFDGPIRALKFGGRSARRYVDHDLGFSMTLAPAGIVAANDDGFTGQSRDRLFTSRYPQAQWIAPASRALAIDRLGMLRSALGLRPEASELDPEPGFQARETIANGYVEATFAVITGGIPIDGNAGLRYAATHLSIGPSAASGTAVDFDRYYDHWLPSINLRAEVDRQLYLRLAWSRQITRPSFTLLSPTVTLDFVNAIGEAGNPRLSALRAWQYDAALEWYPVRGGNLYAAAFYKQVQGFIRTRAGAEQIDGRTFLISRPVNADAGWIGGVEAGFAQQLRFLPGPFAGLGLQASYTFIDSFKQDNGAGFRVPLEQMSRHNHAVALTYDRAGVSAGITWVWRSRIAQLSSGDAFGRPLFRNPYGQLDATVTMPVAARIDLTASVLNVLQRRTREFFQDRRFINQTFDESRRFFVGASVRLGKRR